MHLTDKEPAKLSHPEEVKIKSDYIRGTLKEELGQDTPVFSADNQLLLKFHGIYAQTDRDQDKKDVKDSNYHSLMIRGRLPGGRLTAAQYLAWDELADKYSSGSLRFTTRQSIQLHGVLKTNMRKVVQGLAKSLMTSTGACGDVVRNVMQPANPWNSTELRQLDSVATMISDRYKMQALSYAEIWLNDEMVSEIAAQTKHADPEPIYGPTYLPRKFKVGVTVAGNNSVDIYSQDMGFVASLDGNDRISGYWVLAGGGFGTTFNIPTTFPRLADVLGWIPVNYLVEVSDAIVTTQRDHGDRTSRRQARLKYLIAKKGVDWFRSEVEKRSGVKFAQKELPPWKTPSYLGWHKLGNGIFSLGLHTLSGRIKDANSSKIKTALKEIVGKFGLEVQITSEQDIILLNIQEKDVPAVKDTLSRYQVASEPATALHRRALSCVSFPTCSLAIAESERALPSLLERVHTKLEQLGLGDRMITMRITGCPNGCARPYNAEIGLIGQLPSKYALWLGGEPEGSRLAVQVLENVDDAEIPELLGRCFFVWKSEAKEEEPFGDWAARTGKERLVEILETPNEELSNLISATDGDYEAVASAVVAAPVSKDAAPMTLSPNQEIANAGEEELEEDLTATDEKGNVVSQQTKKKLKREIMGSVEVITEEVTVQREETRQKDGKKIGTVSSHSRSKKTKPIED